MTGKSAEDITLTAQQRGYWTALDLAALSGLTDARIRQLLLSGVIQGHKAGHVWTIPYMEGCRWLEKRHSYG